MAMVREIFEVLEKIREESGAWNKSLRTLIFEARAKGVQKVSNEKEKRVNACDVNPLILLRYFWCDWQESNPLPLGS